MEYRKELGLISSARFGNVSLGEHLINNGCDVNVMDQKSGKTAIEEAIFNHQFDFIDMLLRRGAITTLNTANYNTDESCSLLLYVIDNFKDSPEKIDFFILETIKQDHEHIANIDLSYNQNEDNILRILKDVSEKNVNQIILLLKNGLNISSFVHKSNKPCVFDKAASLKTNIFKELLDVVSFEKDASVIDKNIQKTLIELLLSSELNINHITESDPHKFEVFIDTILNGNIDCYNEIIVDNLCDSSDILSKFFKKESFEIMSSNLSKNVNKKLFDLLFSDGIMHDLGCVDLICDNLVEIFDETNNTFNLDERDIDKYLLVTEDALGIWGEDVEDVSILSVYDKLIKILEAKKININSNKSTNKTFKI